MQQSDIELTISRFSKIEQRLVNDLGATEKNGSSRTSFINRLSEVEHLFTTASIQRLRSIASLRNKLVHGDITSLPDREQFIKDCDMVDMSIDLAKEKSDTVAGGRSTIISSTGSVSQTRRKPYREVQRTPNAVRFFGAIVVLILAFSFFSRRNLTDHQLSQVKTSANIKGESVQAKVIKKGIANDLIGGFLFCKVVFSNLTDRDINLMTGTLTVTDSKGKVLHTFEVYSNSEYNGKIKAKSSVFKVIGSNGFDDYSKFDEKDRLYKNTPLNNLKFNWRPKQIVFEDGTETAR